MEKVKIINENGIEDNIQAEIGVNHIDSLVKFADKHGITYDAVNSDAILKAFAAANNIVLMNMGLIDGKITYTITLPEYLTSEQINCMKNYKEFFYDKCDFLSMKVNVSEKTEYNTLMRNLITENEIYNLNFENNLDILYNEIDNQKRNSK